jgi:hypothetical protein
MNEDIIIIWSFFTTVIVLSLGIPLVRAYVRRQEARPPAPDHLTDERLARIEHAIEAVAVEVERISEGQRFVTRLLADRDASRDPARDPARAQLGGPERHESPR